MTPNTFEFGWPQILRLGLVQACLGAVVVVTTSTLNRVMVVELALPALLPGFLVAWHYGVQMVRPRMGFGADQGRRNTPWMLGGMALLGAGGVLAALATVWMGSERLYGALLAFVASACHPDKAAIESGVCRQAAEQMGLRQAQVLQTVIEKRATFVCSPGLKRPPQWVQAGLWAAGDHVQGPYPATLEGAVRSGLQAAEAACSGPHP